MAQALGQPVAPLGEGVLGRGLPSAGQHAAGGPQGLSLGVFQAEAALLPADARDAPAAPQNGPCLLAGTPQGLEHRRCLQAPGVDPALAVGPAQQSHAFKFLQNALGGVLLQQGGGQGPVPVVVGEGGLQVGQVAPAVSRGQQLFPRFGIALHQEHRPRLPLGFQGPCRRLGGHQPGGPRPHDHHIPPFHTAASLRKSARSPARFPHCTGQAAVFISDLEL